MEENVNLPWGQRYKKIILIIAILLFCLIIIAFVICAYVFQLQWTGFSASQGPDVQQYQPTKTLWDWLQLLFVPIAIALAAYWLNNANSLTEQRESDRRDQTERAIALDNQQEDLLQSYLDRMSDLLLLHDLRGSDARPDVKNIARARTLTVLPRLDNKRKGSLIRFLYESHLIASNTKACIKLRGADLRGADLSNFHLDGADFREANFCGANLNGVNFNGALLCGVSFCHANLNGATLRGADLNRADLSSATLHGASLERAKLTHANLIDTSLFQTDFTRADLSEALVNGAKCDHTIFEETVISQIQLTKMVGS
jgi:Pentapeptide repeats (8 copies)